MPITLVSHHRHNRLHMARLREHVHGTDGGEGKAVLSKILAVAYKLGRDVAQSQDSLFDQSHVKFNLS